MPRLDLSFGNGLFLEQATDFTFVDDATPLGIDDTSGSTGSMNVTFDRQDNRPATMKGLKGEGVILSSTAQEERMIGRVTHVSGTETTVAVDIDSVALRLAVKRAAKPFVGTLGAAIVYWAGLCSVVEGYVEVDSSIASQQVALVGFNDNVWLRIKQLCSATGIEVVVTDDTIVVRPPRAVFVDAERLQSVSWDNDDTNMAQTITVAYYEPENVVAGDYTADYSRSNVSSDTADDAGAGILKANSPSSALPPGYYRKVQIQ